MANPILKEDLIANDVQPALDKMLETLGKIDGALTSMRGSLSQYAKGIMDDVNAHQSDAEAMGKYAAKITELEKAISDLTKTQKENANMQSQVHAAKAKSIELSEYEKRHLEELEKRLKLGAVWQERSAQAIDTTNMSYNAMKATLNTLLSTLRSFETESKKNSTEAMALESAVERLRDAMKELDGNTKAVANAEKQMAEESKKAAKEAADAAKEEEKAYQASQKEAKARADAAQKIHDARQKEIEDAFKARDAEQQRLKLNDQEFAALNQLKAALASEGQARMEAVQGIDIQKMSYNELYQTYNALKDALNKMTVEERLNTEAGKKLTEQSLKIRDTLNELQKSTGNYTLQVGKYRAAFDGLGYSMQQILREAPSALNFNQFFLAISNNIPMFLDQMSAFKKEQAEIQENLKGMTKGTAEYEEQLSKVETVGQKLGRTLLSWQTGVLVLLMIIRKIDWKKLGDNIKSIFKGVREVKNEISATVAVAQLLAEVTKKVADEATELDLVVDRLKKVKQGSEEWKAGVATVNKLTKENLDTTTATIKEVEKVTEAYKKQAEQVAKNGILADMIAKSEANKILRQSGYSAQDASSLGMLLGIKADSKDYKEMEEYFKKYAELRDRYVYFTTNPDATATKVVGTSSSGATQSVTLSAAEAAKDIEPFLQKAQQELDNFINKRLPILSDKAKKELEEQFELINPLKTGKNGRSYSLKNVDFLESELLDKDAVIELESGFKRRLAMLDEQEEKERLVLKEKYEKELKDLEFNKEKKLITEKEYEEQLEKLQNNFSELTLASNKKRLEELKKQGLIPEDIYNKQMQILLERGENTFEAMGVIQRKYWNKRNEITAKEAEKEEKEALKREKKAIKDLESEYATQYKAVQRRIKSVQQEIQQNQDLAFNIAKAKEELAKLAEMEITAGEDATGYTERINKLTQQIEKWKKQMQFDKQLSNYGSLWDIFQRNGAFEASNGTMRGIAKNLLGDLADSLDDEQIEQIYDTWLSNTQKAASTWYSTTMGYINDLISAYVELANAKAEAAAEATEAAQEEYDKEKALLEAGYASRVEATWAEYQEKKAAQEKAEADAKAAAKAQQQLNEAEAMGSLIVASANIWKTFSKIPTVGVPLALAALATMWGSFIQAKVKAAEVSKYGEGGFEVLEGGSHASGHDIDLGVRNRRGRRMRAEGKEGLGIFSRRAMAHYGANNIEAMVNSVNRLEFEGNAAKRMSLERSVGMAVLSAPRTDLHNVESDLHKLVAYGARSIHHNPDGTVVETRKNARITYRQMR